MSFAQPAKPYCFTWKHHNFWNSSKQQAGRNKQPEFPTWQRLLQASQLSWSSTKLYPFNPARVLANFIWSCNLFFNCRAQMVVQWHQQQQMRHWDSGMCLELHKLLNLLQKQDLSHSLMWTEFVELLSSWSLTMQRSYDCTNRHNMKGENWNDLLHFFLITLIFYT